MRRKSIGTTYSMCVQPTFIIGTYNEDGTPDFAPITWVSATNEGTEYQLVISMFGNKKTKQNFMRSKALSVNLVSTDMLELVDYFGRTSCINSSKNDITYEYSKSNCVNAPTLNKSRWVYECELSETYRTGDSHTFFCRIKDIQIDADINIGDTFSIDLTYFDPVIYSGQYHSIGKHLGAIGDFYNK